MTQRQLPKWATRVLAVVMLVGTYVLHHAVIPPGYKWHHIDVMGVISDAVAALAAIGISGPMLAPQLAAFLGNPGAPKPPPKP